MITNRTIWDKWYITKFIKNFNLFFILNLKISQIYNKIFHKKMYEQFSKEIIKFLRSTERFRVFSFNCHCPTSCSCHDPACLFSHPNRFFFSSPAMRKARMKKAKFLIFFNYPLLLIVYNLLSSTLHFLHHSASFCYLKVIVPSIQSIKKRWLDLWFVKQYNKLHCRNKWVLTNSNFDVKNLLKSNISIFSFYSFRLLLRAELINVD